MTKSTKNPEVDKEKRGICSDENLFQNDEMKSEKESYSVIPFYCFVLSHCLYSFTFICSLSMGCGLVAFCTFEMYY